MIRNECLSCGSLLKGRYCFNCGEKVVQDSDFSLSKIVGEGFNAFTNLDNKFFRSLWALMFKPGFLSQEYIEGRRLKYMKPFQLYILASLFLFIFLSDFDVVLIPSRWFFVEHYEWGLKVMELARSQMDALGLTLDELKVLYDSKVANFSKIGLILIIPLLSIFSFFLGKKTIPEFGKHFIINIHSFCFILISMTLYISTLRLIPHEFGQLPIFVLLAVILVYLIFSIKRLLHYSWVKSIALGLLNSLFLFVTMFLYRIFISFFTLWAL